MGLLKLKHGRFSEGTKVARNGAIVEANGAKLALERFDFSTAIVKLESRDRTQWDNANQQRQQSN
jgi:hypothetical protein